ncbi:hypothetical protein GCM10009528_36960 [Kineococcus aurantiacus]
MTASFIDDAYLSSIEPSRARQVLQMKGWTPSERYGNVVVLSQGDNASVLLPLRRGMRGYLGQLRDVLQQVADFEESSLPELVADILSVDKDVHNVSLQTQSSASLPVVDLIESAQGIRAWALACATTEASDTFRPVQATRRPDAATAFLGAVEVAQTRPGSFVLPVTVALPPMVGQQTLALHESNEPSEEDPFERLASYRMAKDARLAHKAATQLLDGDDLQAFDHAVADGLTANSLEALSRIGSAATGFRLETRWSSARPLPASPAIHFEERHIEVLTEAARILRERALQDDVTILGNVTRLHREASDGPGEVTIAGTFEDDESERLRRVTLAVADEDYRLAINAHNDGLFVSASGQVKRSGNRLRMLAAHSFKVRPDIAST